MAGMTIRKLDDGTTVADEVCDCCMLMIENGDNSGCLNYYHHGADDHPAGVGMLMPEIGWCVVDPQPVQIHRDTTCDGCGGPILAETFVYVMHKAEDKK